MEWGEVLMEWGGAVLSFRWKSVKQLLSLRGFSKSALNNLSTRVWSFNVPPPKLL